MPKNSETGFQQIQTVNFTQITLIRRFVDPKLSILPCESSKHQNITFLQIFISIPNKSKFSKIDIFIFHPVPDILKCTLSWKFNYVYRTHSKCLTY